MKNNMESEASEAILLSTIGTFLSVINTLKVIPWRKIKMEKKYNLSMCL